MQNLMGDFLLYNFLQKFLIRTLNCNILSLDVERFWIDQHVILKAMLPASQ